MTELRTTHVGKPPARSSRFSWIILAVISLLILAIAFLSYLYWGTQQPIASVDGEQISATELEERYGLQIRLIGVTAAGGMVDFRLKITDAEKAQSFLEDPANLPRLIVAESGLELMTPEGLDDDIEWQDGGILFNFYPNDEGVIEPGTPVIVRFGEVHLEPQPAQ
jgi:hypothetical protein